MNKKLAKLTSKSSKLTVKTLNESVEYCFGWIRSTSAEIYLYKDTNRYTRTMCEISVKYCFNFSIAQPAITCSKLTIETLEQGVKHVQS